MKNQNKLDRIILTKMSKTVRTEIKELLADFKIILGRSKLDAFLYCDEDRADKIAGILYNKYGDRLCLNKFYDETTRTAILMFTIDEAEQ